NAAFKTMEFKMSGKAILRAFLILALIATAHLIRPFSIKNVTQHMLYSARSFRFVLPAQLRDKFDHANYLAVNLSDSLFDADEGIRDYSRGLAADLGFGPINVQPLEEVNKSATKQKPCQKKSAPFKRVNRTEKRGAADLPAMSSLVAIARSDEIRWFELPPSQLIEASVAPLVPPCLTKLFPARITAAAPIRPIEAALTLRKRVCEKQEANLKARIAWIEDESGAKSAIWVVEKSDVRKINLGVSECEDQPAEATAEEVDVESMRTDSAAPQAAEESKASSLSAPLAKCPKEP
ncbi:MAG TPA: hypothetical protein VG324_06900, partial [Blastocatellia bacterium]|nr:hypothetical protein [Blastocatellia bacterium]